MLFLQIGSRLVHTRLGERLRANFEDGALLPVYAAVSAGHIFPPVRFLFFHWCNEQGFLWSLLFLWSLWSLWFLSPIFFGVVWLFLSVFPQQIGQKNEQQQQGYKPPQPTIRAGFLLLHDHRRGNGCGGLGCLCLHWFIWEDERVEQDEVVCAVEQRGHRGATCRHWRRGPCAPCRGSRPRPARCCASRR